MNKLLHLFGGRLPRTEAAPPHSSSQRTKAGIWLMVLTLLCVKQSDVNAQTYCTPTYGDAYSACYYYSGMSINAVTITGMNGTSLNDVGSSCDGTGYQDRTGLGSGLILGQGNSYSLYIVATGAGYSMNYQAWVDLNDNGTFESSEIVGGVNAGVSSLSFLISIPNGATPGVHRMRVRSVYNYYTYPTMDPCGYSDYGETQDYLVSISCLSKPADAAICMGSSTSLTATGGTSYSWAPATGLSATTGATVTASPTTTTTYTITAATASCGANSTTVTVSVNPLPTVGAGSNVTITTGSSTTLTATGTAGSYSWSPAAGLSTTAGTSVVASPTVTTTYTVTGSTTSSMAYTQTFNYGVAPTTQGAAWNVFRAGLPSSGITGLKISSDLNPTGFTCTSATIAQNIANALRTGSIYSASSDGHTFGAGTCVTSEFYLDYSCSCSAPAAVRPLITNANWGGVGSNTCSQPTQTITLVFYTASGSTTCTNTSTVTVTVVPPLSVDASASTICSGSSSTLTASGSTGYTWAPAAGLSATTGAVVTATPTVTTTYTVTAGGYTATTTVSVNPSPATIGGSAAVCMGSSTTLSNSVSDGSWSSSNTGVATIDASGVVTPVSDGTTNVSYTLSTGCYKTVMVTVNPLPASITGTTDMCMGNTTALSSTSTGGAWSSADASIVNVNAYTGVVTSKHDGATTISYTLPTGCYTTTGVNNIVSGITGSSATCSGLNVTLADATAGGTWSSTDATVAPINISGIITAGSGGAATLSYTMSSGCYRTLDFTVVTTPPAITGTPVVCVGSSTTLANTASGGTWSAIPSAATDGPSGTGIIVGLSAGTNTITYSLSPTCRTSVVVTVNAIPQIITGTTQVCQGSTTSLATYSTGGTWSSTDPSLATIDPATGVVTGIAAGTPSISYAFNSTGCARVRTVTVNPVVPAITGPTSVCVGSTIALTNSATNGTSWTSSNTAVATVTSSGLVTGVSAGVATITFTVGTGCITTANITVGSVPAITGASAVCIGSATTLVIAATGGVWSSSNTAKATVDASGVVTGVTEGAVTINYAMGGCSASKSFNVSPLPNVITGYPAACIGTTTTLTSVGNTGTWISNTPSVATVTSVTGVVTGVATGTSTLTYTVTSTGCSRTAVVTVNTFPVAITGTAVACAGSTATLTNTTTGGSWVSSNTAIATVDGTTGVVTAVGPGTATITYALGANCKVMASFTTRAMPAVIGGTASVCMPVTSTLTDVTTGGTWTSSNTSVATVGSALTAGNGVITGISTGTADITYTITSTGCFRSAQVTVNAGLYPGTISPSSAVKLRLTSAPTATLTSSGAPGGTWTSSNTAVATVNPSTGVLTAVAAGTATITYTVDNGTCVNTAVKSITVAAGRDGDNTVSNISDIKLYPNPTTGMFTLETELGGELKVFTIDGREVSTYPVEKGATQVFLPSGLAAGVYMCRYTAIDGSTTMIRLVYEH